MDLMVKDRWLKRLIIDWTREPTHDLLQELLISELTDEELKELLSERSQMVMDPMRSRHEAVDFYELVGFNRPYLLRLQAIELGTDRYRNRGDRKFYRQTVDYLSCRGKVSPYLIGVYTSHWDGNFPTMIKEKKQVLKEIRRWKLPKEEVKRNKVRYHILLTLGPWKRHLGRAGWLYQALGERYQKWFGVSQEEDYEFYDPVHYKGATPQWIKDGKDVL